MPTDSEENELFASLAEVDARTRQVQRELYDKQNEYMDLVLQRAARVKAIFERHASDPFLLHGRRVAIVKGPFGLVIKELS